MNDLLRPARGPGMSRALFDCNPFYLLSALCMLAGLFALNNSLTYAPLPTINLISLILILNIYEVLLILIAIFLMRRQLTRDATTLLILEALFLVDAGFLNSEAFGQDLELGLAINVILFILAAAKLTIVFLGLGLQLTDARFTLVLGQIVILLAMPGFFKHMAELHNGRVLPRVIYPVWWVVGLIPILYLLLLQFPTTLRHRGIVNTFIALPAISIVSHLCTSNWVYHAPWYNANVSPVLLGLAVAFGASDRHVRSVTVRMWSQLLLPVAAIWITLDSTSWLQYRMGDITMSAMRLTLVAASVVYLHGLLLHRHPYFAIGGTLCLGMAGMGHSPAAMTNNTVSFGDWLLASLKRLVPQTRAQWGMVSVAASFVLLGIGVIFSLFRLPSREAIVLTSEDEILSN